MNIALDVDGILSDFNTGLIARAKSNGWQGKMPETAEEISCWDWTDHPLPMDDEFWLGLPAYKEALEYCPKPVAYITCRPVHSRVTEVWLIRNKFPRAPVYTVMRSNEKEQILRKLKWPVFVDDKQETVQQLNDAGLLCYCMDRGWNQQLDEKYPRIKSLEELQWLVNSQ